MGLIQTIEEYYHYYPKLIGLPIVIDYHCLQKEYNKELENSLYDLAIQNLCLTVFSEYEDCENCLIKKEFTKNVVTYFKKKNGEWNFQTVLKS